MDWMFWTEMTLITVLLNGLAWLFGVDGHKIIAFWVWLTCVFGIFYIIGCIIGLGIKAVVGCP